jgi:hypothetical protein
MSSGERIRLDNRQEYPGAGSPERHPARRAMNHPIGQRWRSDLPVEIAAGDGSASRPGRLLDLSRNGTGIRLDGRCVQRGETLEVCFSGVAAACALVLHARNAQTGLLWTQRPPWLEAPVQAVRRNPPVPELLAISTAPGSEGRTP